MPTLSSVMAWNERPHVRKTCLDCSFAQSTEPRRVHSDITTANLADFLGGELTADEAVGSARSFRNAVELKLSQLEPGGTINSKTLIEALALSLSLAEVCHGGQKAPSSSAARSEPHAPLRTPLLAPARSDPATHQGTRRVLRERAVLHVGAGTKITHAIRPTTMSTTVSGCLRPSMTSHIVRCVP